MAFSRGQPARGQSDRRAAGRAGVRDPRGPQSDARGGGRADDALEADIAFHIASLGASNHPFFGRFRDVVVAALRTSMRFTNRIAGRTASIEDHSTVHLAIAAGSESHLWVKRDVIGRGHLLL